MSMPTWEYSKGFQKQHFQTAADSPGGWLLGALPLKVAADRLDPVCHPVRQEEGCLTLLGVYRMLLGMSMENLLKGVLAVQGLPVLTKGRLSRGYSTHNLRNLAGKVTGLTFSADEFQVLSTLAVYVTWAGRFPLPQAASDLIVKGHSSTEHQVELALWARLYEHLRQAAWIVKDDGRRLYFAPRQPGKSR
jgi:hypothetical protein